MRVVLFSLVVLALVAGAGQSRAMSADPPLVIAHRGASGLRPEHTIAAYALAIEQGADVIEPDLVPTKDGVLVARHENEISETTDVAAHLEFTARRTTKTIDGKRTTGWFTEDFTLAELKTLRAKERLPKLRSTKYDGRYDVPTFDEIIALAQARGVGIYPETKHPSYFASIGLGTDAPLVDALRRAGWDRADAPVYIQSFEVANLKRLAGMTTVRLIQLMDAAGAPADGAAESYAAMATPAGLRDIATYAYGIGPAKAMIRDGDRTPSSLVADAHAAGLKVHPWTFRAENIFLPASLRSGLDPRRHGRLEEEIARYLELGVDGFFTDFPLQGAAARDRHRRR
ncbi:glycerophosphodiester phosphodiesterase [Sphingomonas sp. RS2018]